MLDFEMLEAFNSLQGVNEIVRLLIAGLNKEEIHGFKPRVYIS